MSKDRDRIDHLEKMVAALAAFVSSMPGAPMAEGDTAMQRITNILRAMQDNELQFQDAADQLYDLLRSGPRRPRFKLMPADQS